MLSLPISPRTFNEVVVTEAMTLLPSAMDSQRARAMLITISLQESGLAHRFQVLSGGRKGAARGLMQFEMNGGVLGVLSHISTKHIISKVLDDLRFDNHSPRSCWEEVEHNDALATVFARLLLWTLPDPLPGQGEYEKSWEQYIEAWRPGRPHRNSWDEYYDLAWATV